MVVGVVGRYRSRCVVDRRRVHVTLKFLRDHGLTRARSYTDIPERVILPFVLEGFIFPVSAGL